MAQRRMFNKSITNSSKFLKMPISSRLLYYDLGMNADDDGFVEHFMVLRMTGATTQDLGVLELNGLIKIFDDNVLWIKDWKENNYIQKDRYQPSKYLQMYNLETICIQNVDIGKDSIELGKESIDNNIKEKKYFENVELDDIFKEFLQIRKKIRAVNSDRAIKTLLNKLSKYDDEIKYKMVEQSIVNSWKDLYELKEKKFNNKKQIEESVPEWFNKDNTIKETTKEEQEEMDKLLKDLGDDKE